MADKTFSEYMRKSNRLLFEDHGEFLDVSQRDDGKHGACAIGHAVVNKVGLDKALLHAGDFLTFAMEVFPEVPWGVFIWVSSLHHEGGISKAQLVKGLEREGY